jgi:hypothetical protein
MTAIPANTIFASNDSILQRLDSESATAFETACRLQSAAVEADGGCITTRPDDWKLENYVQTPASKAAGKAAHAAWLQFEALCAAAAAFPAESSEGFASKTRILGRQAQGLQGGELTTQPLAASVLKDAIKVFAADYDAEPDSEADSVALDRRLRIA